MTDSGSFVNTNNTIKDLFNKMEYGFNEETPKLALNWIETNHHWIDKTVRYCGKTLEFLNASSIKFLALNKAKLNYSETANKDWLSADKFHRIQVLQRLSSLLEQNSLLLGQLDVMERNIPLHNILAHDVPYFIQYFNLCAFMPLQLQKFVTKMSWNPDAVDCVNITQLIPLYEICWKISPYLISGLTVKLAVDHKSTLLTLLFIKLCQEAGIPEDVIRLESIDCLDKDTCYQGQSAAVIFECVDIDSAVDSIVKGAWSHHGLIPWSIKRVLVQEPIYDDFILKLLQSMNKLKCGYAFNKVTNFSKSHTSEILSEFQAVISQATAEGFKVHQVEASNEDSILKPTVIIGRPQCLFENVTPLPIITIEAFRTLDEGIKLVKNCSFLSSASLWTNSYNILQKAGLQLMMETGVQTVWLNCHGLLDPSVPFVLQDTMHSVKEDVLAHLFRKSFPEVSVVFNPSTPDVINRVDQNDLSIPEIENILLASSTAQNTWYKFGSLKRLTVLSASAVKLLNQKVHLNRFFLSESSEGGQFVESLVEFMINISSHSQNSKHSSADTANGDSVVISCIQHGVVLLEFQKIENVFVCLQLLLSFIAYGNSVIIMTDEGDKIKKFYEIFELDLPLNLISFINLKSLTKTVNVASEVTPDLDVFSAKAFISKTAWSAR